MSTAATWQNNIRRWLVQSPITGPLLTLIAIFILFSIFVPNFLSFRALSNIVNGITLVGTVTIGITLLMITGEFDLSVGALVAAGGYVFAFNSINGGSPIVALALAVLVPGLLGAINGVILVVTGMPSFIVTLGTLSIFRGFVWIMSGGARLEIPRAAKPAFYELLNGRLDVVNDLLPQGANFRTSTVWIILLVLIFQYVLTRTSYGNHILATGSNPGAARMQGVNTNRVKIINFAVSGALAGFAGVMLFSQFASVDIATGAGSELNAIAAAVVGGTLLTGGLGSIIGGFIGAILIRMLRSGVILLNVPFIPADNFEAIVGVTIVAAAVFNHWVRRRA